MLCYVTFWKILRNVCGSQRFKQVVDISHVINCLCQSFPHRPSVHSRIQNYFEGQVVLYSIYTKFMVVRFLWRLQVNQD